MDRLLLQQLLINQCTIMDVIARKFMNEKNDVGNIELLIKSLKMSKSLLEKMAGI